GRPRPSADPGALRPHGEGRDGESLENGVGVVPQEPPVLERARLALGRVADHVLRGARILADGPPLEPGRESGPPPAPKPRLAHLLGDPVRTALARNGEGTPAAAVQVLVHR